MKTKFTTILTAAALLISSSTLTFAGVKTNDNGAAITATDIKTIGKFNAIEASGNVDVYIVYGDYDAVKVYSDYYGQNAVVQNDNGVLRVTSYTEDKLMVLVTVADLKAITANDDAFIKTYIDPLSAKSLQVELNDNSVAVLNLDAVSANIIVNDKAHAELYGMIENYSLTSSTAATVNKGQLAAYSSRVKTIEMPKATMRPRGLRMHAFVDFGVNASLLY